MGKFYALKVEPNDVDKVDGRTKLHQTFSKMSFSKMPQLWGQQFEINDAHLLRGQLAHAGQFTLGQCKAL